MDEVTKDEALNRVVDAIATRDDVLGAAVIGDGINVMFNDARIWWRLEARDVTALIDAAFAKK